MNNTDRFLEAFKEFEAFIVKLSGLQSEYVSYSKALNYCYSKNKSSILRVKDNYSFLKNAGELRNLLSHSNDLCVPTDEFIEKFLSLTKRIQYPTKVIDIATPANLLITAGLKTNVISLVTSMKEKGLTHVPVIFEGKIIGLFSMSTLFEKLAETKKLNVNEEVTVNDFINEIQIDSHSTETFAFCKPDAYLYDYVATIGKKTKMKDKRLVELLITSNGKDNGKLLGIVTPSDLLKL